MKIYDESAVKELMIRYGCELRDLQGYLNISFAQVPKKTRKLLYNECRLRLLFVNELKNLLTENRKSLEEYNGQYIRIVRDINKLKSLIS